jgi:Tol biopolymer transport system component
MKEIPLIPRKVFFGNPDRESVQISQDGAHLAWLAPLDGVLNVWVAPCQDLGDARAITHDTGRGIRFYGWSYTNKHILYIQDKGGDENWRLFSVDLESAEELDLTPFEGTQVQVKKISPNFPEVVLVGLNNRVPEWHDIYRVNILTGEMTLLEQNDQFMDFTADDDYQLRLAYQMRPDGGLEILQPDQKDG